MGILKTALKAVFAVAITGAILKAAAIVAIVIFAATTADARAYCDRQEAHKVGIATAVGLTAVMGVATVATMPIVGPGIAAGSTVGIVRALSGAIFRKTTLPVTLAGAPMWGITGFFTGTYGACISQQYGNM